MKVTIKINSDSVAISPEEARTLIISKLNHTLAGFASRCEGDKIKIIPFANEKFFNLMTVFGLLTRNYLFYHSTVNDGHYFVPLSTPSDYLGAWAVIKDIDFSSIAIEVAK